MEKMQYGVLVANPKNKKDTWFIYHDGECCGVSAASCLDIYEGSVASSTTLKGMEYQGKEVMFENEVPVNDPAAVKLAIARYLENNGWAQENPMTIWVRASYEGGKLNFNSSRCD